MAISDDFGVVVAELNYSVYSVYFSYELLQGVKKVFAINDISFR